MSARDKRFEIKQDKEKVSALVGDVIVDMIAKEIFSGETTFEQRGD